MIAGSRTIASSDGLFTKLRLVLRQWEERDTQQRAERLENRDRTFQLREEEPLGTSYGADLYHEIFQAD